MTTSGYTDAKFNDRQDSVDRRTYADKRPRNEDNVFISIRATNRIPYSADDSVQASLQLTLRHCALTSVVASYHRIFKEKEHRIIVKD